ncbi:hypothetical protein SDC9_99468 [bioreactor metagenome]|uniref:Uncharacterized protein n=1 Tax=bioreactor metagenome TaxID=1076179 RepID=A0A645AI76_9ZZZZ
MPMSLLFHQTLSAAVSSGSLSPAKLAGRVLSLSPFRNVDKNDYRDLLVDMIKRGYLQQTEEKELICGEKGERLAGNFKFYAVFKDSEDYTVRIGSEEIGTITSVPPVGDRFALAGHVWEVEEIDVPRKLIYVKRVKGKMEISWPGDKGEIHTKILKRMKRVIEEDIIYPYLMPNAAKRLNDVRQLNKNTRFTECGIIPLVNMSYVMFPWLGTRSVRTFRRFLKFKCASKLGLTQIEQDSCYYLTYKAENCSPRELALFMKNYIDRNEIRMSELVGENEHPIYEKYDDFISQKLLLKSFYTDKLDFTESKERINEIDAETRKQQAAFQQQK